MQTQELLALARDRRLVTPELHPPNDFYGHATLLKRYAGLPLRKPLKAAVEHGPFIGRFIWDADLQTVLPVFLCCSAGRAQHYERHAPPSKRAVPIGPMTAYVDRSDSKATATRAAERKLLAFPAHSTHRVRAAYDVERFASLLADIGSEWDAVEVCVYWRDVIYGVHRTFERYGFDTVTAGHMYDPAFLPRLVSLLQGASAVVTNEFGSHVLYATSEERPTWVVDQDTRYAAEAAVLQQDLGTLEDWVRLRTRLQRLFAEPQSSPTPEQRRFVEHTLGLEHVRTPEELRSILHDAEATYRRQHNARERFVRRARRWAKYRLDWSAAAASSRLPRTAVPH